MAHIVLLGDSVFDNAAYVPGDPDVRTQLQEKLPNGWKATLLAIDGNVTDDVHDQLKRLPDDTSHLILSVGGNDALGRMDSLTREVETIADALNVFSSYFEDFQNRYQRLISKILSYEHPTAVCTIYYPRFEEPELQRIAITALSLFNDCIIRTAVENQLPILDLRLICSEDEDYANPIEPSSWGGDKIAEVIADLVAEKDFGTRFSKVIF